MSSLGYHQFEVEYEKKKYSGDPDRVTKSETYKIPKEFRDQTVGYHSSIMKRIQGHPESAAVHNKHKAAGFQVSEKPIKFKTVHEEVQIDEISTKTALSYASKAGDSQDNLDTTTDAGHRKFWNRQKGQALALDKVHPAWKRLKAKVGTTKEEVEHIAEVGDTSKGKAVLKSYVKKALDTGSEKSVSNLASRGGFELGLSPTDDMSAGIQYDKKAVVRSKGVMNAVKRLTKTEDVDTARAAHAKAKDLEDKGHEAERMGDEKKMRKTFAAMVQQKMKSKEAMKDVKEAAEPKPKSMIPQAKQDLQKSKELFKKVQAVGKEMKNPGYSVDDRVNHFRLQHHMHNILVNKRSEIASKAIKNEEIELVEAGQDKNYHEFWADRTRRKIGMLKQKGKPIPSSLLSKLKKHQQALSQIKSGRATQVAAESADVRTLNTASRDITTTTRIGPDGRVKLVKRKQPRTEIEIGKKSAALPPLGEAAYSAKAGAAGKDLGKPGKNFAKIASKAAKKYGSEESGEKVAGAILGKIRAKHMGEAINKVNMMQDSINKMVKMDPLALKTKIVLPPSQGLKPIGGEDQVHANMAEEKLNRLYESLSEKNKVKFMEKLDTEEGFDQLIRFAEEQGF